MNPYAGRSLPKPRDHPTPAPGRWGTSGPNGDRTARTARRRVMRAAVALDELGRLLSAAADACTAYGTIMAHGDDEEGRDRRDTALADAHRALAALKGRLHGQEPDVGAAIGSLVADCQALLDDLTPEA